MLRVLRLHRASTGFSYRACRRRGLARRPERGRVAVKWWFGNLQKDTKTMKRVDLSLYIQYFWDLLGFSFLFLFQICFWRFYIALSFHGPDPYELALLLIPCSPIPLQNILEWLSPTYWMWFIFAAHHVGCFCIQTRGAQQHVADKKGGYTATRQNNLSLSKNGAPLPI